MRPAAMLLWILYGASDRAISHSYGLVSTSWAPDSRRAMATATFTSGFLKTQLRSRLQSLLCAIR